MKTLVFDIEIEKLILAKGDKKDPRYRYCYGWRDFKNMGIACVGAYTSWNDRYRVFGAGNLGDLSLEIHEASLVVGFNNHNFDNLLLEAVGVTVPKNTFDVYKFVKKSLGVGSVKGYSLSNLAKVNGVGAKGELGGADAPKAWQDGKYALVIDYCLQDVKLTWQLFKKLQYGELIDPNDPMQLVGLEEVTRKKFV